MRTDGKFTVHECSLGERKKYRLLPFGDVHYDSPGFCENTWKQFLEFARDKDTFLLGMGDYTDSYSTSERVILGNPGIHESTRNRQEKEALKRIERLAQDLDFAKGRFIGLLGGNHYIQFRDGTTGDMKLAEMLGADYLGACSFVQVRCNPKGGTTILPITIFAHHGKGGGKTAGGKFNSVEDMLRTADADVYLMGDNHARGVLNAGDRLYLRTTNGRMTVGAKTRWLGRTGSFLRAYMPGEESYVVDACLQPASLGWIWFDVEIIRDRSDGRDTLRLQIRGTQ